MEYAKVRRFWASGPKPEGVRKRRAGATAVRVPQYRPQLACSSKKRRREARGCTRRSTMGTESGRASPVTRSSSSRAAIKTGQPRFPR